MGRRTDLGLVFTARVIPCGIVLGDRPNAKELARHRDVLREAAHDKEKYDSEDSLDTLHDSLTEGTQGLGGLALLVGVLAAGFIWLADHMWKVPASVLAAFSFGVLTFCATLAAIYGMRATWIRRPGGTLPRLYDFWIAIFCGTLIGIVVAGGLLGG